MKREVLRTWRSGRFELELSDTGSADWRGKSRLAYEFRDAGQLIFSGEDFCGSPLHADDSDETVAALLTFLSLRPGDTDRDYFDRYTPKQLDWARTHGEELSWLATELEERARKGFIGCEVESHFNAWRVTLEDGATILLQSDYNQAAFAVACGVVEAPEGWDGLPSKLGNDWIDLDPTLIYACPAEYREVAELEEPS